MLEKIKPYFNFIFLAIGAILFVLLCRGYLYHDGAGVDTIRKQLDEAGANQQSIGAGITESTEQAQDIREEIASVRGQLGSLADQEQSAGSIIADCKQILAGVRKRGKTNTN